ncbi:ATP-binding cassette domain-containing protein, partial [Enterococcus faecalis]
KVFDNLSFSAKENKLTAIVGYSGGGKSTIAKLIAGYWNINKGKISVGNVNLKDVSLEKNMELVTYVSQENYLFRKSIIDNMRMANQNASIEEIKDACKKASCHDFIMSLPNGYETIIGESGSNLSGGERQRLTIARALLKDSPIVLLDEATAYSDPDNEAEIQKSIDALVENKTVIMIAHRLSTIIGADKIIVLNNGEIEAEGTHKELLGKSETYAKMWKSHISLSNDRGE